MPERFRADARRRHRARRRGRRRRLAHAWARPSRSSACARTAASSRSSCRSPPGRRRTAASSAASSATSPSARRPRRRSRRCWRPPRTRSSRSAPTAASCSPTRVPRSCSATTASEILERPVEALFAERSRQLVAERIKAVVAGAESGTSLSLGQDMWGERRDGTEFPVDVTLSTAVTDDGPVVTGIIRDVTERKRFETQLKHLADHDALTDLFNRRRFEEELVEYASYAAALQGVGRGPAARPRPLQARQRHPRAQGGRRGHPRDRAAPCARASAAPTWSRASAATSSRYCSRTSDRDEAERIAGAMLETVRERELPLEGHRMTMTTSIGIALFDDDSRRRQRARQRGPRDVRGQGRRRQPLRGLHARRRAPVRHAGAPRLGRPDPPRRSTRTASSCSASRSCTWPPTRSRSGSCCCACAATTAS